jgi:hypothetical protein
MDKTYHFPWMDSPRSEPRDQGKTPKYLKPEQFVTVEQAQLMKFTWKDPYGNVFELPSTLMRRPNTSYLGHQSPLFETPWPYEDRWTGNDPFFRRIPGARSRTRAQTDEMFRLADIENPGRCRSRRRWVDGWCHRHRYLGGDTCDKHMSVSEKRRRKEQLAKQEEIRRVAGFNLERLRKGYSNP